MTPNYVAKKSLWKAVSPVCVLFFWLIFPIIIIIVRLIEYSNYRIEFYDNRVITKSGVLSKRETQTLFAGVLAVSINQSLWGRMFNYGDVKVDVKGKWDIDTHGIKDPRGLQSYLENYIVDASHMQFIERA